MIVPVTFAYFTGYFFARKHKIREEMVIPKFAEKKKYSKSKFKKILSVVVVISTIMNVIYQRFFKCTVLKENNDCSTQRIFS